MHPRSLFTPLLLLGPLALLITNCAAQQQQPMDFNAVDLECIWSGGNMHARKLNIVLAGDGFREPELLQFELHADRAARTLLEFEPYATYSSLFRIYVAYCISKDHGGHVDGVKGNNTCFNVLGSDGKGIKDGDDNANRLRQMVAQATQTQLEDCLLAVLCDSPDYGGKAAPGSLVCRVNVGEGLEYTLPHEIGHALARLSDEYDYTGDEKRTWDAKARGESACPNVTAFLKTPKWKEWLGDDEWFVPFTRDDGKTLQIRNFMTIGLEEGAYAEDGYYAKGVWRPGGNRCNMKTNSDRFCGPCREGLIRALYQHAEYVTDMGCLEDPAGNGWWAYIEVAIPAKHACVLWYVGSYPNNGKVSTCVTSVDYGPDDPMADRRTTYYRWIGLTQADLEVKALVWDGNPDVRSIVNGRNWIGKSVGPIQVQRPTLAPK